MAAGAYTYSCCGSVPCWQLGECPAGDPLVSKYVPQANYLPGDVVKYQGKCYVVTDTEATPLGGVIMPQKVGTCDDAGCVTASCGTLLDEGGPCATGDDLPSTVTVNTSKGTSTLGAPCSERCMPEDWGGAGNDAPWDGVLAKNTGFCVWENTQHGLGDGVGGGPELHSVKWKGLRFGGAMLQFISPRNLFWPVGSPIEANIVDYDVEPPPDGLECGWFIQITCYNFAHNAGDTMVWAKFEDLLTPIGTYRRWFTNKSWPGESAGYAGCYDPAVGGWNAMEVA
jgi:hypothetical protein